MKHLLIILCCVVLVLFAISGLLYFQLSREYSPTVLTGTDSRSLSDYNIQVETVEGWQFLEIPNPYLDYPEAPIQLASEYKDAYMLVIPERVPEDVSLNLDDFYQIVADKINQEHDVIEMSELKLLDSEWSQRGYFTYSSEFKNAVLKWYVQLDVADQFTYRTIGWSVEDKFEQYNEDFKSIATTLRPINKRSQANNDNRQSTQNTQNP